MDSKLICYLCCICLLWSCEYKIHENFVDIEKPQDSANASIDLNAVTDGQTILINKETELNYSLTAFGKDIKGLKFKMGDIVWSDSDLQPNGSLMISSSTFPSGNYFRHAGSSGYYKPIPPPDYSYPSTKYFRQEQSHRPCILQNRR